MRNNLGIMPSGPDLFADQTLATAGSVIYTNIPSSDTIRINDLSNVSVSVGESTEFRDFIVWLCGYTDRSDPPSAEDWEQLREETKQVAAKFALTRWAKHRRG